MFIYPQTLCAINADTVVQLPLSDTVTLLLGGSFNGAIDACGKGGEWQFSLMLLASMEKAGVPPNEVCDLFFLRIL